MKLPKELREKSEINAGGKTRKCTVIDCGDLAIRSLSENKWKSYVEKAKFKIVENKQKKIYLCKNHYKEVKKLRKSEEKLYQKKGFLDDRASLKKDRFS